MDRKKWQLSLLGLGIVAPLVALAQEDASRLEKRFEKSPEPKSTLNPLIFPIQEQVPPEQAGQIRFTLKDLTIVGNTAFSRADLEPIFAELIGKEITLLDIYRVRDAITARYGNAGFGLSKALVPEQRIQAEGLVRIQVLEGFIDDVIIEGSNDDQQGQQAFFAYAIEQITAERPSNARTLERYLLLANDRFAIKVTSTLKKSEKTPGATTLILQIEPAPKIEGGVTIDNRGTVAVGTMQINGNISVNGLFDRPAQTTLSYATVADSRELQYWTLAHTDVLSEEGTSLTLSYSISTSQPGTPVLRLLEQKSDSDTLSLKLAHPFIRTRQENLTASVKYEEKGTTSKSLGAITAQDKLRSIRLGVAYDKADSFDGVNQVILEHSAGLKGMGATDQNSALKSRVDGMVNYRKTTLNLSRKQELGILSPALSKLSINAAFMGQSAPGGLLSGEECGIGGQQFGRAYDSSEITGDRCIAASLELRFTPSVEGTTFKYAQFYSFYDGGRITNENPLSANDPSSKSLTSAGLGVRFGMGAYFTGSIELTQPITRIVANEGNQHARGFASFSLRF